MCLEHARGFVLVFCAERALVNYGWRANISERLFSLMGLASRAGCPKIGSRGTEIKKEKTLVEKSLANGLTYFESVPL